MTPVVCDAVLLRQQELKRFSQSITGDDARSRRARHMVDMIELDLLRKWGWSPNQSVFQQNVEHITRKQIKTAEMWSEEVDEITDDDARVQLERRIARVIECERAAHMKPMTNYIYDVSLERAGVEADEGGEEDEAPPLHVYLGAWFVLICLVGYQVVNLLQNATAWGRGKTLVWIKQSAIAFILFYIIVLPLEVLFFFIFIPRIMKPFIKQREARVLVSADGSAAPAAAAPRPRRTIRVARGDPASVRPRYKNPMDLPTFPFKTKLPASPVYYLCQRHPEFRDTPIGAHALGTSALEGKSQDEVIDNLKQIHRSANWKAPTHLRLTMFFMMFFMTLPEDLQMVARPRGRLRPRTIPPGARRDPPSDDLRGARGGSPPWTLHDAAAASPRTRFRGISTWHPAVAPRLASADYSRGTPRWRRDPLLRRSCSRSCSRCARCSRTSCSGGCRTTWRAARRAKEARTSRRSSCSWRSRSSCASSTWPCPSCRTP